MWSQSTNDRTFFGAGGSIDLPTGAFSLAELGGAADEAPEHLPVALKNVDNWASWRRRF